MRYVATVSASNAERFETIATYHGDLGTVRRKAGKKLRQWRARAVERLCTLCPMQVHNWGESWEGRTADGRFVRLSATIRVN